MTQAIELREQALAALMDARAQVGSDDRVLDDGKYDAAMARFKELDGQWRAASGLAPLEQVNLGEALSFYTGKGKGMGGSGVPFPGGAGISGPGGGAGAYSWGQAFIEARQARGGGVGFSASVLESGSTAVAVPLRPEPVTDPRRARFIFELLREEDAPGGVFSYMRQTLRELNAAVVARGARKPVSHFKLEKVPGETKTVATITDPVYRFDIEDAPMLRQFIDDELRLGVNLALDALVVAAIIGAATPGGGTANLAAIRGAITDLQMIDLEPNGIAMDPVTWESVEAEALAAFAANSNAPAATDAMARRLYGVPVAVSPGIDTGQVLVGDFAGSAEVYITGGVRIDVSDSIYMADAGDGNPGSTWEQNALVFRGERRAEAAILRPAGFILLGTGGS